MTNLSTSSYDLIKKDLDAVAIRNRVVANNIANINTKGFKRQYVSFEEQLKKSVKDIELKTTDRRHLSDGTTYGSAVVKKDTKTSVREDGNNVDMDIEMMELSSNQLLNEALVSNLNSRYNMTRSVINGK
ncbi:flagellar basal body rod protein FlgB [Clostridium cellulovorans]|uniref:Flagellar basal body rod protein FlgB n=1 Tax=Clostridium cellulovorans (strain ATCC 35296 / DSM 3052 / OCM 3 / 743B) TaxID=573061 RepID=D9SKF9_CLOC7|nr:flagellar basal body rod protein FlgB [Clostridium cellulovorans]ADL51455.1 flagellar basal-body rod protein FlgB [Clostridium cellulovorans 743B]